MRVLGKEIYCPVCRTELKQVGIIEMEVTCDVYITMLFKQGNWIFKLDELKVIPAH